MDAIAIFRQITEGNPIIGAGANTVQYLTNQEFSL
jgi:hypothetical protein